MATCITPFGNDGDRKWHASPAKLAIAGTTGLCLTNGVGGPVGERRLALHVDDWPDLRDGRCQPAAIGGSRRDESPNDSPMRLAKGPPVSCTESAI
jgi:hypothetical protein